MSVRRVSEEKERRGLTTWGESLDGVWDDLPSERRRKGVDGRRCDALAKIAALCLVWESAQDLAGGLVTWRAWVEATSMDVRTR